MQSLSRDKSYRVGVRIGVIESESGQELYSQSQDRSYTVRVRTGVIEVGQEL